MLRVEEAINIILENTITLGAEMTDISSALNRVLAQDVYSLENIPPFNNSAMDGYAVISERIKGSSQKQPTILKILGDIPAGYVSDQVVQGDQALRIMTGAPVPEGADAIVPVEFTEKDGLNVKIYKEVSKWKNIRFAGEDVLSNQLVIPKGKVIRPAEIGMLAALNIGRVSVIKTPMISILATGDELVNIGEELLPGKIRNINSYCLQAEVLKHGCIPLDLGVAKDNKLALMDKLKKGKNSDMLIISGGVSVGDYDYVKNVLAEMGMKEIFWKVAIKPGKPILFGKFENTLVFGLPGNPVSAMVTFEQFVLPAIHRLQGRNKKALHEQMVVFEGIIENKFGFRSFIRGKTFIKDGRVHVKPINLQGSGIFSSMVQANCNIVIPENVTKVKNGDMIIIQITGEIGEDSYGSSCVNCW